MNNPFSIPIPGVIATKREIDELRVKMYQRRDGMAFVLVKATSARPWPDILATKKYLETLKEHLADVNHWYIDGSNDKPVSKLCDQALELLDPSQFTGDPTWYTNRDGLADVRKLFDQDIITDVVELALDLCIRLDKPVNSLYQMIYECAARTLTTLQNQLATFVSALEGNPTPAAADLYQVCDKQVVFTDEEIEAKHAEEEARQKALAEAKAQEQRRNLAADDIEELTVAIGSAELQNKLDEKARDLATKLNNKFRSEDCAHNPKLFEAMLGLYGAALATSQYVRDADSALSKLQIGLQGVINSLANFDSTLFAVDNGKYRTLTEVAALTQLLKEMGVITVAWDMVSHDDITELAPDFTGSIHVH